MFSRDAARSDLLQSGGCAESGPGTGVRGEEAGT